MGDDDFKLQRFSPQEFLNNEMDQTRRIILGNVTKAGYELAMKYIQSAPSFLRMSRAKKLIPEIKNMAVEYSIMEACNRGSIPLQWSIENTNNPAIQYLKLTTKNNNCVFTVNQTASAGTKSRDAKFRNGLSDAFQSSLNLFLEDNKDNSGLNEGFYFEINHGYESKEPKFAIIGRPMSGNGWDVQYSLLNQIQLLSKGDAIDVSTATEEIKEFNQHDFEEYLDGYSEE